MGLKLIIANKKYSSWSLRPWLAMKMFGVEFEEVLSPFDMSTASNHFYDFSPSKKVPVLIDGDQSIWDSMAILEYLAETYPDKNWWPKDQKIRAMARSIAHEMHGGFGAIRDECPMNFGRVSASIDLSERAKWEFSRLEAMWEYALTQSGGPFLFADFGIVDAMYAPIVSRVRSYEIKGGAAFQSYLAAIESLPHYQDWAQDGQRETWVVEDVENRSYG
ncbi:MAG: glutathione S-transferase family protein [Robiginitomaculum sp.]|nr:glutathione S-transferase family protein [Robiginitomaculum sp.]